MMESRKKKNDEVSALPIRTNREGQFPIRNKLISKTGSEFGVRVLAHSKGKDVPKTEATKKLHKPDSNDTVAKKGNTVRNKKHGLWNSLDFEKDDSF